MPFCGYFLKRGVGAALAKQLSAELQIQCPWLDFSSELSESLAEDLLGSKESLLWLGDAGISDFVEWYNAAVEAKLSLIPKEDANEAYVDLLRVVKEHGQEDPFGDGDFWVVEDSMASSSPVIVLFHDRAFTKQLAAGLARWRERHRKFESLLVTDRDGNVVRRL